MTLRRLLNGNSPTIQIHKKWRKNYVFCGTTARSIVFHNNEDIISNIFINFGGSLWNFGLRPLHLVIQEKLAGTEGFNKWGRNPKIQRRHLMPTYYEYIYLLYGCNIKYKQCFFISYKFQKLYHLSHWNLSF